MMGVNYHWIDDISEEPPILRDPEHFRLPWHNHEEKPTSLLKLEVSPPPETAEIMMGVNYHWIDDIFEEPPILRDPGPFRLLWHNHEDIETKKHDKIHTEDTPLGDQNEDEESKWKECIQKKDVKAARKMLDDGNLPNQEELQFAVNNFTYSNETREVVKDICQRIAIPLLEEHEGIDYIKGCFKHDDPDKKVIFVIKTSKPTTVISPYHWYVLKQNNEEALKEIECENSTEYQSEEMFQKACECLRIKSPDYMEAHSNLTSTSVSPVKLSRLQTHEKAVCIVFYVEAKGYIPIGEGVLPEEIEYDNTKFVTDVREGQCATAMAGPCDKHEDLKIGCQIVSSNMLDGGTLGCFVIHPTYDLCAISCAHVVLTVKEFEEVFKGNGNQNVQSLCTIQCFQPTKPDLCGDICDIRLFKRNKNNCGMDIAFFKVNEDRKPKTTAFPDVLADDVVGIHSTLINDLLSKKMRYNPRSVMQNSRTIEKGLFTQVVKYGMESKLTSGKYRCSGTSVKLKLYGHITTNTEAVPKIKPKIFQYILADQIEIRDNCGKFSKPGDSGAMVFVLDENKDLMALGILTGRNEKTKTTFVTPIWNILEEIEMPLPYVLAEPRKAHAITEELKRSVRSIINNCEALTSILEQ